MTVTVMRLFILCSRVELDEERHAEEGNVTFLYLKPFGGGWDRL